MTWRQVKYSLQVYKNCTLHSLRQNNNKILGYVRQVSDVANIH